jgi:hypothetical protein
MVPNLVRYTTCFSRIILDKLPQTEEEFKPCLDELAAVLVKAHFIRTLFQLLSLQVTSLFEKKTFSTISTEDYESMCRELNLISRGAIEFADTQVLLGDVKILDSFARQAELLKKTSLSGVCVRPAAATSG